MRTHRPHVIAERSLFLEEFELLLRRAEKFQKLRALRSMPKLSRVRKRPVSAA